MGASRALCLRFGENVVFKQLLVSRSLFSTCAEANCANYVAFAGRAQLKVVIELAWFDE